MEMKNYLSRFGKQSDLFNVIYTAATFQPAPEHRNNIIWSRLMAQYEK
jgi:hypothetical protein